MVLNGYQVDLESVQLGDAEMLRHWRNDDAIAQQMLSQEKITVEQQTAWIKKILDSASEQHFIIKYRDQPIGSANIKARGLGMNLQQTETVEPGLYIAEEKYRGNIVAFAPTLLLNDYCFYTLGVKKLIAVVKKTNTAALKYNEKLGYKVVEEGEGDCVTISLNEPDYQSHTSTIKALLSRPTTRDK